MPNGVPTASQFDNASRVTQLSYGIAGALGAIQYGYDTTGYRTSVGGSLALAVLPQAVAQATTNYDAGNRQLHFADKTLTYDGNGNVSTLSDGAGLTTFTWDARNRLAGLSGPSSTATFTYDGLGRRIAKTISGTTTQFLYDAIDVLQEVNATTTIPYLRGLSPDEPFVRGGTDYYLTDALGSTIALTGGTGAIATTYSYQAFGQTSVTGTVSANSFQFTGRENDGTGFYYYRARYYHPTLQRFLSEDPIGFVGGDSNLYAYVHNSPLAFVDPLGWRLCRMALPGFEGAIIDDSFATNLAIFIGKNIAEDTPVTFNDAFRSTADQTAMPMNPNATIPASPGSSLHEAGFAVDVNWSAIPTSLRATVVKNASAAGLRWGGDFRPKADNVHFYQEVPGGPGNRSRFINQAQRDAKCGNVPDCATTGAP